MNIQDKAKQRIVEKEALEFFEAYKDLGITRKDVLEYEDFSFPEVKDSLLNIIQTKVPRKSISKNSYTWGMDAIDKIITTPKKGQVFLLASSEGNGKTTFANYMHRKNRSKHGQSGLYLSLEASKEEIWVNIALGYANTSKIDYRDENYKMNPAFQKKMKDLKDSDDGSLIGRQASDSTDVKYIREMVNSREQVDFLIVDNLSCISLGDGHYNENEAVKQIMTELIGIAQDGNFPIILICHYRKQNAGKKKLFRETDDIAGSRYLKDLASGVIQVARSLDLFDELTRAEFHIKEGKVRIGGTFDDITIYFHRGEFHADENIIYT